VFDVVAVVFELIDGLVDGEKREGFGVRAEATPGNIAEPFEVDAVDGVEIIIPIVSDLADAISIDNHKGAEFRIIEAVSNSSIQAKLLSIFFIFSISHLVIAIDLVDIELMIHDKKWIFSSHKHAMMFLNIAAL
jgi:hypothetical protein